MLNFICAIAMCLPLLGGTGLQEALNELDGAIERKDYYDQLKLSRISQLKQRSSRTAEGQELYYYLDDLYDEYFRFDVDSAYYYAHRKLDLAKELDLKELVHDAAMDLASRYMVSGMYYSAKDLLEQENLFLDMSSEETARYYQSLHTLYHNLRLSNRDMVLQPYYLEQEHHYQHLSEENLPHEKLPYYTVKANMLISIQEYRQARALIGEYLHQHQNTNADLAELYYWIAKSYLAEGDAEHALQYYAESAYYDVVTPLKSSRAMVQCARLSLQRQDIEHAYRYITNAYEGASEIDARICLGEVAQFMPDITKAYESLEKRRYHQLFVVLLVSLLLMVISITFLIFTRRYHNRLTKANRHINEINSTLQESVAKLKEANSIKESYLGRYMSMFSSHIDSLERYRSSLRHVAKSMDLREVQTALKSNDFIDSERESLYQEFDRSFLGVFPDFVPQLNALLQEDKRIGLNLPEGRLSNELRIFALIRLGVTESAKIAQFLKKSPSTIYNYRVKLRNAAVCSNQEFEERLMEIGKPL